MSLLQYARLEMERQGMHIPGKYLDINPEDKEKYPSIHPALYHNENYY